MTADSIVLWGAGGHASVLADIIKITGGTVAGLLDDVNPGRRGEVFCGSRILGGREELPALRGEGVSKLIVAIGDCAARLRVAEMALQAGFTLASAVHPRAVVAAGVTLGPGTVVMAGAVINPGAKVGANVIVNTGATVDHDCVLEDGVHICPGAHLAGEVRVRRATWIGIGAIVNGWREIGAGTLVGAGAVVVKDLPANVVAFGNPARVIRPR